MAKIEPLTTISAGFNSTSEINSNFTKIVTALNNTLSRDGSTPNFMDSVFDLNSNRMINLLDPVDNQDAATKNYVDTLPVIAAAAVAAAASAAAAALSETNAATSETNAATSAASAFNSAGAAEAVAINWVFDDAVAMANPGTGEIRFNNSTIASVTQIAVAATTNAGGNPDVSEFIVTWDDSTNAANRGTFTIKKATDTTFFAIFSVSDVISDNGSWLQIPVTFVSSNGSLTALDSLFTTFARTGNQGTPGGGTGDMLGANNLSDVVSGPTSLSNIGGIGAATANTLTNKTFDANGAGNTLSNVDVADLANGVDGELITWDAAGAPTTVAVGTSGQVLTSNGAGAAPTMQSSGGAISGSFISAEQTISNAGLDTLAHSLGALPVIVDAYIICKIAQAGYIAGDIIRWTEDGDTSNAAASTLNIRFDATNIFIRYGNNVAAQLSYVSDKTSGAKTLITAANWNIVVRAFV